MSVQYITMLPWTLKLYHLTTLCWKVNRQVLMGYVFCCADIFWPLSWFCIFYSSHIWAHAHMLWSPLHTYLFVLDVSEHLCNMTFHHQFALFSVDATASLLWLYSFLIHFCNACAPKPDISLCREWLELWGLIMGAQRIRCLCFDGTTCVKLVLYQMILLL